MPVDDNAFMTLRTVTGQTAFLHVSCTEWKNLFSFEIYGRSGKIAIDGLGGSMSGTTGLLPDAAQMGPPEATMHEHPGVDQSWALEFAELLDDIRLGREPSAGLGGARRWRWPNRYAQSN
jgi:predicted dehydrogenase